MVTPLLKECESSVTRLAEGRDVDRQSDAHDETCERLREVFAVRRQQPEMKFFCAVLKAFQRQGPGFAKVNNSEFAAKVVICAFSQPMKTREIPAPSILKNLWAWIERDRTCCGGKSDLLQTTQTKTCSTLTRPGTSSQL
jgi:hypothetical protein